MSTVLPELRRRPRRYLPGHPLSGRPPLSDHRSRRRAAVAAVAAQPRHGVLGLGVVAVLTAVLLFAWGGAHATSRVFGVLVLFALPVTALIALWWEDWPGARLRPRWAGWADVMVVVAVGVALAWLGQAIVQHPDVGALFTPDDTASHIAPFPALLPLGAAVFTVFLQFTLVTEGWPLRARGRLAGGALALLASWLVGLMLERLLVATHLIGANTFLAVLAWVSAFQVVGWVVLGGHPLSALRRRPVRLAVGNVATVGLGTGVAAVAAALHGDQLVVGALGAAVAAAGLLVGMLFEGWPFDRLTDDVAADSCAVLVTLLLACVLVGLSATAAHALGFHGDAAAGWTTYAVDTLAAAVIVHVGIFRRWPLGSDAA